MPFGLIPGVHSCHSEAQQETAYSKIVALASCLLSLLGVLFLTTVCLTLLTVTSNTHILPRVSGTLPPPHTHRGDCSWHSLRGGQGDTMSSHHNGAMFRDLWGLIHHCHGCMKTSKWVGVCLRCVIGGSAERQAYIWDH